MNEAATIPTNPRFQNLTGKKFERLHVAAYAGKKCGISMWRCVCDCGNETLVGSRNLVSGHTRSCGCLSRELASTKARKHGASKSPEYGVWTAMKARCANPNVKEFKWYGGRGITVCSRWAESFANFLADMGDRPSDKHSLDRKDNDGNYEPANCHWATRVHQARNSRKAHVLTFKGESFPISVWAEKTGLDRSTIRERIKSGWPVEQALTLAPLKRP